MIRNMTVVTVLLSFMNAGPAFSSEKQVGSVTVEGLCNGWTIHGFKSLPSHETDIWDSAAKTCYQNNFPSWIAIRLEKKGARNDGKSICNLMFECKGEFFDEYERRIPGLRPSYP